MIRSIFISFKAEDETEVRALRLESHYPEIGFEYFAISDREAIKNNEAADIRRKISEKIARTDLTVCFVSPATYESLWVRWELEESFEKSNEVIAMVLKGVTRAVLPKPIRDRRLPLYPWNPTGLLQLTTGRSPDTGSR